MLDLLRPWMGLALGIVLAINGWKMLTKPNAYVGVGIIPASDPRTVKWFGVFGLIAGVLNVGLNLPQLFSE